MYQTLVNCLRTIQTNIIMFSTAFLISFIHYFSIQDSKSIWSNVSLDSKGVVEAEMAALHILNNAENALSWSILLICLGFVVSVIMAFFREKNNKKKFNELNKFFNKNINDRF